MVAAWLVLGVLGGQVQSGVSASDRVGLRVRVYVDRGLDQPTVERAEVVSGCSRRGTT